MSEQGLVLDIDSFSTHDGPGIRTAVFLKGCPLSCRWCHSPESQSPEPELLYQRARCKGCLRCMAACPIGAIGPDPEMEDGSPGIVVNRALCQSCYTCAGACHFKALRVGGMAHDSDELARRIAGDMPFFRNSGGGVTVTGGEPLMQPRFTAALLAACRGYGVHTLLETCGHGSSDALLEAAANCDMIYFDIKQMDPELHRQWTGVTNKVILANLERLCQSADMSGKLTVRVPCIPNVNDSPEDIAATAAYASGLGISRIQLLPYNPMAGEKYNWIGADYGLAGREPRDKAYYNMLGEIAEKQNITAIV